MIQKILHFMRLSSKTSCKCGNPTLEPKYKYPDTKMKLIHVGRGQTLLTQQTIRCNAMEKK